jgi:hypothetical protein
MRARHFGVMVLAAGLASASAAFAGPGCGERDTVASTPPPAVLAAQTQAPAEPATTVIILPPAEEAQPEG